MLSTVEVRRSGFLIVSEFDVVYGCLGLTGLKAQRLIGLKPIDF